MDPALGSNGELNQPYTDCIGEEFGGLSCANSSIVNFLYDTDRFIEVVHFATTHHRGQCYPETDIPHVAHLWAVSDLARKLTTNYPGLDPEFAAIVSVLHDIIEDTDITHDELVRRFGFEIADGVLAMTRDRAKIETEQIPDCLIRIKEQPKEVWIAKISDRIYNLKRIADGDVFSWGESYVKESRLICNELLPLGGVAIAMLDLRIKQCERVYSMNLSSDPEDPETPPLPRFFSS
jgi:hypothetical protein